MTSSKTNQLYWLDLIRGIAALLVLAGHLRSITFNDFSSIAHPTLATKVFYFATSLGHEAVMIFFVLSGFFIIKSIVESFEKNTWSWKKYAINRLSRLWMVLIPGLLLGALWDNLGLQLFPTSFIYNGSIETIAYWINPTGKLGADVFIGNLFFLQTLFFPPFGSNGALWSLTNEFWYYTVFPLIYVFFTPWKTPLLRFALAAAGIVLFMTLDYVTFTPATHLASYFFIWLMGGVSYFFYRKRIGIFQSPYLSLFTFAGILTTLFFISTQKYPLLFNDYSLGVWCSLLVVGLAHQKMTWKPLVYLSSLVSNISYTLYIVHLPFIVFITSYLIHERMPFDLCGMGQYLAVMASVLMYSYFVYYLFERNTYKVKSLFRT